MIEFKNTFHNRSVELKGAKLGDVLPTRMTNKIVDFLCGDSKCSCHKIHGEQEYALSSVGIGSWKIVLQKDVISELKEFTKFS